MITFILIVFGAVLFVVVILVAIVWKLADQICKAIMEAKQ